MVLPSLFTLNLTPRFRSSAACFSTSERVLCLQVLLRKGGIREANFSLQADHFWLFPNSFHSKANSLKRGAANKYSQVSELAALCIHT